MTRPEDPMFRDLDATEATALLARNHVARIAYGFHDRVDIEPPIFKGCSSSELLAMLLVAVAVWIPLSLLLALAMGKLAFSLAILAVITFANAGPHSNPTAR